MCAMSEWSDGRKATIGVMYCPCCAKMIAVPEDFAPPELLKCQTCGANWLIISMHPAVMAVKKAG
jgi:hypothetical protein